MRGIRESLCALLLLTVGTSFAQTGLWITGSAVPGGTQQLESYPNGQFKYAGTLNAGELKIMNTPVAGTATQYLAPCYEDAYVVNKGVPYQVSTDVSKAEWKVTFREDRYRFTVSTSENMLRGELFQPWEELFVVGGAAECGWQALMMLPMTRDADDPNVFTWTGELKERREFEESRRFKIMGQDHWQPKSLHPYVQDEPVLSSSQVLTNSTDNKWSVDRDGIYHIKVNVFRETFQAVFMGK